MKGRISHLSPNVNTSTSRVLPQEYNQQMMEYVGRGGGFEEAFKLAVHIVLIFNSAEIKPPTWKTTCVTHAPIYQEPQVYRCQPCSKRPLFSLQYSFRNCYTVTQKSIKRNACFLLYCFATQPEELHTHTYVRHDIKHASSILMCLIQLKLNAT